MARPHRPETAEPRDEVRRVIATTAAHWWPQTPPRARPVLRPVPPPVHALPRAWSFAL